jgi:hypothetical protein
VTHTTKKKTTIVRTVTTKRTQLLVPLLHHSMAHHLLRYLRHRPRLHLCLRHRKLLAAQSKDHSKRRNQAGKQASKALLLHLKKNQRLIEATTFSKDPPKARKK